MKRLLFLVVLSWSIESIGQQLRPVGKFLHDSVMIGEEVPYTLSISYPREMELLFPDSNYTYFPFEFSRKEFFPSRIDSVQVTDSAVYYLSSFEIDPVQHLSLPVYLLTGGDSTEIMTASDSVFLIEMVPVMPDSVSLKEDVSYVDVNRAFNYPYFFIGTGIFLVLAATIYFIFGKQIRQRIQIYRLKRSYEKFARDFEQLFVKLKQEGGKIQTEKLLVIWKSYMEKLEDRPYTKLTSKEIARLNDATEFADALKLIDRGIYGNSPWDQVFKSFETLEDVTTNRYSKKVMEVKNG